MYIIILAALVAVSYTQPQFDGKVRLSSDGSYQAYMVPIFAFSHGPSLELAPHGLMLAWYTGSDRDSNSSIIYSYLTPDSNQWNYPYIIALQPYYSSRNPVPFYDTQTGSVLMYYSQTNINQTLIEDQALGIWVTRGLTFPYSWGPLFPFYMNPGASTRGRIIETSTGLLLPAYDSSTSFMLALDSLGRTWNIINMSGAESLAQPTLVRLDNTTIMCFLNNMENGDIYTSRSTDEGLTWTPPKFNMISNSGISSAAYQLASGAIVMVFGSAYISPSPLVVALSYDGGDTWPYTRVLQNQDGTEEFSYPSVLQDNEGYIHVAYTYNRLTIKYMRITEKWIRH